MPSTTKSSGKQKPKVAAAVLAENAFAEYAAVLAHALETFGSRKKANSWLNRENQVFKHRTPLQILTQDAEAVEQELVRIDHGMLA